MLIPTWMSTALKQELQVKYFFFLLKYRFNLLKNTIYLLTLKYHQEEEFPIHYRVPSQEKL